MFSIAFQGESKTAADDKETSVACVCPRFQSLWTTELFLAFGFDTRSGQSFVSAVEVGGGPAGAFQFETRGGKFLDQCILAALRALRQRLVTHLLKEVFFKAAIGASVSVDRHGRSVGEKQ